ncbi:unnamed protein product [Didymodactylos carnosus]|uniref:HAT C-terminal dimerisation domain-containing protein n=1 Tax=Didymodactylos carnosus TaxID=1234261 RepID=A0A8S2STQ3_9BILA|nr:unnamed protein product [Didymodactylos carnosus]CAF4250300.1 unnamed protein product [Didymodactylos carnosus]
MDVAIGAEEEDGDQQILDENGIDETKVENGEDSDDEFEDDGSIFDEWGEGVIADDTCALTDQTLVIQLLQKLMNVLHAVLKPFYRATKIISVTNYPTISLAYFAIYHIQMFLENTEEDNEITQRLKMLLLAKMSLYFYDDVERFNNIENTPHHTSFSTSTADVVSKSSKQSIMDEFLESVDHNNSLSKCSKPGLIVEEIKTYRSIITKLIAGEKNASSSATKFWKTYSNQLPILSKVARKYLAAPGPYGDLTEI